MDFRNQISPSRLKTTQNHKILRSDGPPIIRHHTIGRYIGYTYIYNCHVPRLFLFVHPGCLPSWLFGSPSLWQHTKTVLFTFSQRISSCNRVRILYTHIMQNHKYIVFWGTKRIQFHKIYLFFCNSSKSFWKNRVPNSRSIGNSFPLLTS